MSKGQLLVAVLWSCTGYMLAQNAPADDAQNAPKDPIALPANTEVQALDPTTAGRTLEASPTGFSVASTTGVTTDLTTGGNAQSGSNLDPDQPGTPASLESPTHAQAAVTAPPPVSSEPPPSPPPAPVSPAPEPPAQPSAEPAPPPPQQLPQTASPLPLLALLGFGSLVTGAITRKRKS
jgi:hypothetical protein